tara:strand:+ start:234 stop:476 length:243 start_codon:yes stop_codon:yes gene_type:complete
MARPSLTLSDDFSTAFLSGQAGQQAKEQHVIHPRGVLLIGIGQCAFADGLQAQVVQTAGLNIKMSNQPSQRGSTTQLTHQ